MWESYSGKDAGCPFQSFAPTDVIFFRTFDFSKHLLPEKTKEELKFDFEAVRRQQRLNNQKDLR